jgi:hypothetical protein
MRRLAAISIALRLDGVAGANSTSHWDAGSVARYSHGVAAPPIYVEILIRGPIEQVWEKTQAPGVHQRWDLRFSEITYRERQEGEPQRFDYATRIGAGIRIEGEGESVGTHEVSTGERTSSLKFWSADQKSLIATGSGYWRYIPEPQGTRFLTWYDYRTRFGAIGRAIDRVLFRPLIGWATAWSFDRLRLWIELGIPPDVSRNRMVSYTIARGVIATVWLYHGLVPKLIFRSASEAALLANSGIHSSAALLTVGWAEIMFGAIVLLLWRAAWPLWATLMAMVVALATVALTSPNALVGAFNPVTFNLCVAALALVSLLTRADLPSASRCRRAPTA